MSGENVWERWRRHPFFVPILIALLLHAAVLAASGFIRFVHLTSEREILPRFHVKGVETSPVAPARAAAHNARRFSSGAPPPAAAPTAEVLRQAQAGPQLPKDTPLRQNAVEEITPKTVEIEGASAISVVEVEALLRKTEERQLQDRVQPAAQRSAAAAQTQASARLEAAHRFNAKDLLQALQNPLQSLNLHSPDNIKVDPDEGMPGFTPSAGRSGLFENLRPEAGVREADKDVSPYESLDPFLDIEVVTYRDPADGQGYYMIKIFARKDAQLQVMPKEILFTIDCSLSMNQDRLNEVKKGITRCLQRLNEKDVFNIVAFRDTAQFFSPRSVSASPDTIRRAEAFVAGLTSNQRTDVNGAFEAIIRTETARRPSNVMLISDGRPTHGIVDDRKLLAEVTRTNSKVRPVFAFSGGRRVNRYLLDFLAYQNRGWAQYMKSTGQIASGLADFYDKIRDPIFLNLRYELSGLDEADVYPKSLPDFYRNAEFTIFGTYSKEGPFSMQLLGDIDGQTKQLVFTRDLADAKKGSEDVKKGYAFNKIYHLISRLSQERDDTKLLDEIQALSRRYGVTTPYSPELANMD